jgi:hypothetical protein
MKYYRIPLGTVTSDTELRIGLLQQELEMERSLEAAHN